MKKKKQNEDVSLLNLDTIRDKIYIIRGTKIMLDKDLAMLYGVPTKVLNQAVKRNIKRFPKDFMFQLTKEELSFSKDLQALALKDPEQILRSQFVTSKENEVLDLKSPITTSSRGGRKYLPLAFTEQGIAMLSSVLNSDKAIQVNIQIIRIFTKLREMIDVYKEIREKVDKMEKSNESSFREIFDIINEIIRREESPDDRLFPKNYTMV